MRRFGLALAVIASFVVSLGPSASANAPLVARGAPAAEPSSVVHILGAKLTAEGHVRVRGEVKCPAGYVIPKRDRISVYEPLGTGDDHLQGLRRIPKVVCFGGYDHFTVVLKQARSPAEHEGEAFVPGRAFVSLFVTTVPEGVEHHLRSVAEVPYDQVWVQLSGGLINATRILSAKLAHSGAVRVTGEIKCPTGYVIVRLGARAHIEEPLGGGRRDLLAADRSFRGQLPEECSGAFEPFDVKFRRAESPEVHAGEPFVPGRAKVIVDIGARPSADPNGEGIAALQLVWVQL